MSNQSVDDLIMSVVGMGFEIEDAQEAIQKGKLSAQDIVEWILAGKPTADPSSVQPTNRGNTLKLGSQRPEEPSPDNVIGSNPFLNPQPAGGPVPMDMGAGTSHDRSAGKEDQEEDKVKTRFVVNEEQRKVKERFEEKQRLDSQKKAKEERIAKKKAHEQVLSQIKEDRERAKILKASAHQPAPAPTTSEQPKPSVNVTDKTTIQIRLPDGRALRQQFTHNTVLQEVWNFVISKFRAAEGLCLVQPFPRVEYGGDHMEKSLAELSLVPSGSLVLNKPQNKDKPTESMDTEEKKAADESQPPEDLTTAHPAPNAPPAHQPPQHNWGGGHSMGGQEGAQLHLPIQEENAPVGEPPEQADSGSDSDEDMGGLGPGVPPPIHPGPGGGGMFPPGAGGGGGGMFPPGMGGGGGHGMGHMWGEGQSLVGQVLPQHQLPHQHQDPKQLAAEAARQRYTRYPPGGEPVVAMDIAPAHPTPAIRSLSQMLIQHLCARICDPRNPLLSLQGVPADLANKVIEYLIKERLLKPKTLKPFISCRLRKLILDCYPYVTNELVAALKYHPYLLHLSLCSSSLITDKGLQPLVGLSRLKVLSIGGCRQLTNNSLTVIQEMKNLVTLILEDTGITDEGVVNYAQSSPEHLHTLDLSRTNVTQQILQVLPAIPELKVLNLEGTQVGSLSGVQRLLKLEGLNVSNTPIVTDSLLCLQNHPALIALNISNTENVVGDLALQYIAGLQLQVLNLPSRHSTTDEGIKHISGMPLQNLDLTNYINVGDPAMEAVCNMNSLRKLRLSNTKVSDAGLVFLEKLSSLEELLLDRTTVTDAGAEIIGAMSALQELSLSETGISDGLLKSGVLNSCVMLTKLNLSKTHISDKGIVCLKLAHLSLLNIDHTRVRHHTADALRNSENLPQLSRVTYKHLKTPSQSDEDM